LVLLIWAFAGPAGAATVTVFGVTFDPANGTTQAGIAGGGYATPYGTALYSGGSDDWVPPAAEGRSLGTYFQVPGFQPEYDPDIARLGDVGSSVSLGNDPKISHLTNARDIISTRWDPLYGLENVEGPNMETINELAIFEKGTSEAYAIRVHNATTGAWTPWFYEIFNQTDATQFTTPTEYDLSALGVGVGEMINALEITNLSPGDTVATSTGQLDGVIELGFGVVTFGGDVNGYAPARRRSLPNTELKLFEAGKHDPDIQFVVGLQDVQDITLLGLADIVSDLDANPNGFSVPERLPVAPFATPIPPAVFLMLPALGVLVAARRPRSA